jgi:hypothetical protein
MRLARDLGFTAPTGNSLDAVSDRDFVAESLSAAALCAMHLSRLAEDIIFYATGEAGLVELSDAVTSGSSLMPQKKNPDALELIRGKSGRIVGSLMTLLTVLKGLPLAYNKDLQEDKEPLFDAMDHLSLSLRMLAIVLDGMTVRRDRAREAALGGYSNATELADYLVAKGVPFRDAHHDVGRLVREAIGDSTPLEGLSVERMAKVNPRIGSDVFVALTVDSALAKRDVPGGTAPTRVSESIERGRLRRSARRVWRTSTPSARSWRTGRARASTFRAAARTSSSASASLRWQCTRGTWSAAGRCGSTHRSSPRSARSVWHLAQPSVASGAASRAISSTAPRNSASQRSSCSRACRTSSPSAAFAR